MKKFNQINFKKHLTKEMLMVFKNLSKMTTDDLPQCAKPTDNCYEDNNRGQPRMSYNGGPSLLQLQQAWKLFQGLPATEENKKETRIFANRGKDQEDSLGGDR